MTLVGISGKMESGKDAAFLRLEYLWHAGDPVIRQAAPKGIVRIAFADKLKISAMRALGIFDDAAGVWTANDLKENGRITVTIDGKDGDPPAEWVVTGREYLQWQGTEAHRDMFGGDFWVDAALPLDREFDPDVLYAVTDTRFPNEATRVRELGGLVVEIIGENEDTGDHPSEQPLSRDLVDVTVNNKRRDDGFKSLDTQLRTLLLNAKEYA